MPATIKKDLYIAKNITELNSMTELPAGTAGKNCRMLISTASKMFEGAEEAYLAGDEERAYVLFMKYFNVASIIKKSPEYKKDAKYCADMLGQKNSVKALEKAEELSANLKTRYMEKEAEEVSKKLESLSTSKPDLDAEEKIEESDKKDEDSTKTENLKAEESIKEKGPIDASAPPGGITVRTVYRLLNDATVSIVLMDLRSTSDYEMSHVRHRTCISLPADIVPPGSTVNHIGKKLPTSSTELWNARSDTDYIIMFDWRCSASTLLPKSPIQNLKDALYKWDVETTLKNEPLVMEGGYEQWLLCYPAFTTNANVTCPLPDDNTSSAIPSLDFIDYDVDLEFLQPPKPPPVEEINSSNEITNNPEVTNGITIPSISQLPAGVPTFDRSTKPKPMSDKNIPGTSIISEDATPTVIHTSSIPGVSQIAIRGSILPNLQIGQTNHMKSVANTSSNITNQQREISRINNQLGNTIDLTRSISSDNGSTDTKINAIVPPAVRRDTKPIPRDNQNISERNNAAFLEDSCSDTSYDGDLSEGGSIDQTQKKNNDTKKGSRTNKDSAKQEASLDSVDGKSWELNSMRELKAKEARELANLMRMKRGLEDEMRVLRRQKQKEKHESMKNTAVNKGPETSETVSNQHIDTSESEVSDAEDLGKVLSSTTDIACKSAEETEIKNSESAKHAGLDAEEQRKAAEAKKKEEEKFKAEERRIEEERKKKEEERQKLEQEAARQAAIEQDRQREIRAAKEREAALEKEKERQAAIEKDKLREIQAAKEREETLRRKEEESRRVAKAPNSDDGAPDNLPPGWSKQWHETSKKYFYLDHNTKQTQWNPPAGNTVNASPSDGSMMYKKRLRDEEGKEGGSGLKRSHSFHNLSTAVDKNPQGRGNISSTGFANPTMVSPPQVDRLQKPAPTPTKVVLSANVAAAKVRNLQPTYGSNGKGLTGLRNLGNTCYMNSIVQCLSNTAPLTIYFLSDCYLQHVNRNARSVSQGEVAEEFGALVKALWSNQYRAVSPRDLRGAVCKLDSMFATSQHQDAQELLEYLMNGLNEDLNQVKVKPQLKEQNNDNIPDKRAAEMVWEQSLQLERSIIVDLFRGQYKSTVTCLKCDKKSVVFEQFMCLTLPIPSTTYCNLTDCLAHFCKEEKMTGDSKWFCPRCACKRDATKRIVIWKLPPILLVHLKRFYYQGIWRDKITTNVDFPLRNFDMTKCIAGPDTRQPYTLYAVTNHFGTLDGGHYTAYCRSQAGGGDWYKFDDQDVYRMPESNVQSSAAYMLFYSSMKLDYGHI